MSENESNWWLARSKKVPFLTEQVNRSGGSHAQYTNWLKHDYMNDQKAVTQALKEGQERLKKSQESNKDGKKTN